ncbi:MAG: protoporphyrinogen oxidase [Bacillota bacterium]|nr:protoporphyrinogen oxidase [Bacillota bacterium]
MSGQPGEGERAGRPRAAVVGGGVAGLAAALELRALGLQVVLLERAGRLGGKVRSERVEGFLVEYGPDSFVTYKPGVVEMARRLGLEGRMIPTEPGPGSFIWSRGRLEPVPAGLDLMVPADLRELLATRLLSWRGKLRALADLVIPPRSGDDDESLESFVLRRLGREVLERLAEPLIAGIHGAPPERMSLRAAFPRYAEMEREQGSLIRAALARRRQADRQAGRRVQATAAPGGGGGPDPRRTFFMSFDEGMGTLATTLAEALAEVGVDLRPGSEVEAVEEAAPLAGARRGYRLRLAGGETLEAEGVVVATPAGAVARLLAGLDPGLAELAGQIGSTPVAVVNLAYREEAFPEPPRGSGFVVPAVERRRISGVTYASNKFRGRAPAGTVLLRVFLGGSADPSQALRPEAELVATARAELEAMLGLRGQPLLARAAAWREGLPAYTVGHLERVAAIERRLEERPGLALAGASYRGIGVPDCIASGLEAARRVAAGLAGGGRARLSG